MRSVPPPDFEPDEDPHPELLDKRQFASDDIMRHHDPVSLWFGDSPTYFDMVQRE